MTEETLKGPLSDVDPKILISWIDKCVKIKLIRAITYTGFLKSIDPATGSIILLTPKDEGFQTILIVGHSVRDMVPVAPTVVPPETKRLIPLSSEELEEKKKTVLAWLKRHLLPITEEGPLLKLGDITLFPPYSVLDISTHNVQVYRHLKILLEEMPKDFNYNL